GWGVVLSIGFGTGAVYILRWYWSRINAWSEIYAMIAAAAVTLVLNWPWKVNGHELITFTGSSALVYAKQSLVIGGITTIVWVLTTVLKRPEPHAVLIAFYRRVHPAVYGWGRIAKLVPELPAVRDFGSNAVNWVLGTILVYGCLFGIGKLIFGQWISGVLMLGTAAVCGYLIFWNLSRVGWGTLSARAAATR